MPVKPISDLIAEARRILEHAWQQICRSAAAGPLPDALEDLNLLEAVRGSVRSRTKSYRYVLPTQLVAKIADPGVDARSLQASHGVEGAFDARSVAHNVIVPFDSANDNVLGGSPEPYVNNPLRVAAVTPDYAQAQKDRSGWSDLCRILEAVERTGDAGFTERVFRQVLVEIHRRLGEVRVSYPVPFRISLDRTMDLIARFLDEQSGGDRAQAVAAALFWMIGKRFGLYRRVVRAAINTADAASGLAADLECLSEDGEIVLAVEVKDKGLTWGRSQPSSRGPAQKRSRTSSSLPRRVLCRPTRRIFRVELRANSPAVRTSTYSISRRLPRSLLP